MFVALTLTPGAIFAGDFRVVAPLSTGGMGAVYVVHQLSTDTPRALKIMRPELLENDELRRRFEQEARLGAQIASDHVVEIVSAGVDRATNTPWLAMELLTGETLEAFAKQRGPLPFETVEAIFGQLGHALAAAHEKWIVHRDLKPENVFLTPSRRAEAAPHASVAPFTVKVLDFGIAKTLADAKTRMTAAIGTPLWMAPEQSSPSAEITPAADVWPLGLIAFRLLTGKLYWLSAHRADASAITIMREVLMEPMPPASQRAAELGVTAVLPPGFDAWFARCCARDPRVRFQTGKEAIESFAASVGRAPAPAPEARPSPYAATLAHVGPAHTPPTARGGPAPVSPMAHGARAPDGGPAPPPVAPPPTAMPRAARRSSRAWVLALVAGVGALGVLGVFVVTTQEVKRPARAPGTTTEPSHSVSPVAGGSAPHRTEDPLELLREGNREVDRGNEARDRADEALGASTAEGGRRCGAAYREAAQHYGASVRAMREAMRLGAASFSQGFERYVDRIAASNEAWIRVFDASAALCDGLRDGSLVDPEAATARVEAALMDAHRLEAEAGQILVEQRSTFPPEFQGSEEL